MELQTDPDTKNEALEKLPFLKPIVAAHGYDSLATYLLKHGAATECTMETLMAPKTYSSF